MPSGKTHLQVEFFFLVGWLALGVYLIQRGTVAWATLAAFAVAYGASMALLSPDLDLVGSRPFKRWGPIRFVWWPYAKAFRHRRISHHWFWGPLGRVAYVMAIAFLIGTAVAWMGRRSLRVALPSGTVSIAVALGLYAPNVTHIAIDALCSWWKRHRRRL